MLQDNNLNVTRQTFTCEHLKQQNLHTYKLTIRLLFKCESFERQFGHIIIEVLQEPQLNVKVRLFGLANTYIRMARKVWTCEAKGIYVRGLPNVWQR